MVLASSFACALVLPHRLMCIDPEQCELQSATCLWGNRGIFRLGGQLREMNGPTYWGMLIQPDKQKPASSVPMTRSVHRELVVHIGSRQRTSSCRPRLSLEWWAAIYQSSEVLPQPMLVHRAQQIGGGPSKVLSRPLVLLDERIGR